MNRLNKPHIFVAPLITVLLSVALFCFLYFFDNKYNTETPQPQNGVLLLSEDTLEAYPMMFLINGWEFYPGLLGPDELHSQPIRSGKNVFIGQYTGFDAINPNGERHGSATLALNIAVPEGSRLYALELPEIYSAYRLYINGELLYQMGSPEPGDYAPATGDRLIMFAASENIELIIAMSDYSHYYSGLVYPPAFGTPDAVSSYLMTSLVIRSGICIIAFLLGLPCLIVGIVLLLKRQPGGLNSLLYGILCLCFLGSAAYPIVKLIGTTALWWYSLEQFCYCAMLLFIMLLQSKLCDYRGGVSRLFPAAAALITVCTLFAPLISQGGLTLLRLWSLAIEVYYVICAAYLTAVSIRGLISGTVRNSVLLCGALIFDAALIMDLLLPDYEPIYVGWFIEWAGAAMVILLAVVITQNVLLQYRQRRLLKQNIDSMTQMMETEAAFYPIVMAQADEARAARHDVRHHMTAVQNFVAAGNLEGLGEYLEQYRAVPEQPAIFFCENPVINMLLSHFASLAAAEGIEFTANADLPKALWISDPDLFSIVANLLENAVDASRGAAPGNRWIRVGMRQVPGSLAISVDNAFDSVINEVNGRLLSRKHKDRIGIGTASAQSLARRYGGNVSYSWENTELPVFHALVLLPNNTED